MSGLIKICLISGCLILFGSTAHSQQFVFSAEYSYGTFALEDLKKLQQELATNIYFSSEAVEKFPSYMGYGISSRYRFGSGLSVGIASDFFSTGGRNHIADYSGYYKVDFLAHAFNLLTIMEYDEKINKKFSWGVEIGQGLKFSTLKMEEEMVFPAYNHTEKITTRSLSWLIKPLIRIEYGLTDILSLGIFAGGEINPESKLHLADDPDAKLVHEDGNQVRISWSGLRTGISLKVRL